MTVSVQVKNLAPTFSRLSGASGSIRDTAPLTRSLSLMLARETMRGFVLEVDPFGRSWAKSKRALKDGGQTLTDTGRLRSSYVNSSGQNYAEISTNLVYARFHQEGGPDLPRRQMLGYGQRIQSESERLMREHLVGSFNGR